MKKKNILIGLSCLISVFTLGSCAAENPGGEAPVNFFDFEFNIQAPQGFKPIVSAPKNGIYKENSTLSVAISYTETETYNFDGYYLNGTLISEELSYTFDIIVDTLLTAKFSEISNEDEVPDSDDQKATYNFEFKLNAPSDFDPIVSAPASGKYLANSYLSIAIAYEETDRYIFDGYFVNGQMATKELTYSFNLTSDTVIIAKFSDNLDYVPEPNPDAPDFIEKGKFGYWDRLKETGLYFNGQSDGFNLGITSSYSDGIEVIAESAFGNKVGLKVVDGKNSEKYIAPYYSNSQSSLILTDKIYPRTYDADHDAYLTLTANNIAFIGGTIVHNFLTLIDVRYIENVNYYAARIVQEPIIEEPYVGTIKVGLQTNLSSGAACSAINQGYFKKDSVNVEPIFGAGPALATLLVAGNIDVSFMGNGVAWNYFTESRDITLVAFDNLPNDDKLIARKGGAGDRLTADSSLEDLASSLRGSTIALDLFTTSTTFLTSLVTKVNESLDSSKKIRFDDSSQKIPYGLETYAPENEINIINIKNSDIASLMKNNEYDFCVAYAPTTTTLLENSSDFTMVASYYTHLAEYYTPSTWAVNTTWLENNEEVFEKFMKDLVMGMNFRRDYPEQADKDIEVVSNGAYIARGVTDIAIWLGAEEQLELLESGDAMKYVNNIRESQMPDRISDEVTAEDVVDFTYLENACRSLI